MAPRNPQATAARSAANRMELLDGLRGVLATLVVLQHALEPFCLPYLFKLAHLAVLAFFTMSGYVLALSYDGRPAVYMARRAVRLWPLYALCVVVGSLVLSIAVSLQDLTWMSPPTALVHADPPAWSVVYEAWAIPVSPLLFWMAGRVPLAVVILAAVTCPLGVLTGIQSLDCIPAFLIGLLLAGCGPLGSLCVVPGPLRWLGKVSFSLYLTHALLMLAGNRWMFPWGGVIALPAVLPVAWLAWRYVERPSIAASRAVGRLHLRLAPTLTT